MAGRLRVSYSTTMKDSTFRSDCNIDCCDNGSQGHNEDGIQRDPDFVEDRFRVDRKKLEHMLQGKLTAAASCELQPEYAVNLSAQLTADLTVSVYGLPQTVLQTSTQIACLNYHPNSLSEVVNKQ